MKKKKAVSAIMLSLFLITVSTSTLSISSAVTPYTKNDSTLSWSPGAITPGWHGWWFRRVTEWFQFTFDSVRAAPGDPIHVELYLAVANHEDGEYGLDGMIEVVINPGGTPTKTYTRILLDNVDPTNLIYGHQQGGSPNAYGSLVIPNGALYVKGGQLKVRVVRHTDSNGAPVGQRNGENCPIDNSTTPIGVPTNLYENDDPYRVHLFVWCEDGSGGITVNDGAGWGYCAITYNSVGGLWVPVDKLAVLAPYICLASILVAAAASAIHIKRRRR